MGVACAAQAPPRAPQGYTVVAVFPHDSTAYTQGLLLEPAGTLLESTGLYGRSDLRRVVRRTGQVEERIRLPAERFGEGIALYAGKVYQLTWQSGVAYLYDAATLQRQDSLPFEGEGWGLTTDGRSLIMSDGSDTLRFLDPGTLRVERKVAVTFANRAPAGKLNELEYARGAIFANVYQSDWILRIDPSTGLVEETLDLSGLLPDYGAAVTGEDVLNGIAFDEETGHLLVTGKRWPRLFELRLDRVPGRL